MAARRTRKTAAKTPRRTEPAPAAGVPELPPAEPVPGGTGVETTGRFIVIFKDDEAADVSAIRATLNQVAGIRDLATSSDFEAGAVTAEAFAQSDVVSFEALGVVVVSSEEAVAALAASTAAADSPILAIEPEYIAYLSTAPSGTIDLDYLRGYRDAVNHLYEQLGGTPSVAVEGAELAAAVYQDTAQFTWGLQATRASTSRFTGRGIKVAVLDTGLDFQHPDFRGRAIVSQTFTGVPVQDVHGHGTHCIGTSCGPQRPATGVRRYGVATAAQIFAGKVFNNAPRPQAPTGSVIAGLEWAVTQGCRVASLSLGIPINQKVAQYEVPMRRALNAGTLVVAAAGNNANRPANPGFVEPPANADAAMAIAAVDRQLQIATFSGRSSQVTGVGGIVNVAGPGVAVFSSVPVARGTHALFNGTSMATPHAAGIAALWSEATGATGNALWTRLLQSARPLTLPAVDVGSGLVQAPQ